MRAAMIGDNCIDVYCKIDGQEVNRRYPTGNVVDTGVNLQKLGIPTSIISTTGSDEAGQWMIESLKAEGLDLSALLEAAAPYRWAVTVRDHTRVPQNLWGREAEDSLTGLFLRDMRRRIEAADGDEEKATLEKAVRFGLTALENGEDTP